MSKDFTLSKYSKLCSAIIGSGAQALSISDYIEKKVSPDKPHIILRHDVDRDPFRAARMARLEHSLGLRSTYYFRDIPGVFDSSIIKDIADLGHEIGYHYETLALAGGDYEQAIERFQASLNKFKGIVEVSTISMHGRPFSRHDSRDLWRQYDYRDFGILGEAYLSIDYGQVKYFCDTGRTWHSSKYNVRDTVQSSMASEEIDSTDELIGLIESGRYPDVCISSHPNRWCDGLWGWCYSAGTDYAINLAKLFVKRLVR